MTICRPILLVAIVLGAWPARGGPIPSGPIYTNKSQFRIPFHYDADDLQRLDAREIRLLVSRDRGRTWQPSQTVAPTAGKFQFQATGDGEYWFCVRTLDGRNRLYPDGPAEAGLQVIVDTSRPRLHLNLRSPERGKVQLTWSASDEHLDPAQLQLEYMQPGVSEWQPLTVVPIAEGQHEWSVPQAGLVSVRGTIADLAKNTVREQTSVQVQALRPGVAPPRAPEQRQPIAGPVVTPRSDTALTLPKEFPGGASPRTARAKDAPRIGRSDGETATVAKAPNVEPPQIRGNFVSHRADDAEPERAASSSPENSRPSNQAGGPRRRVLGSYKFQIGYRLHDADASNISSVELYITDDGGKTWYHYPSATDKKSPAQVEVSKDGVYGFTLGVRDAAHPSGDAPQNGDAPAMEVVVDTVPPTIEFTQAKRLEGAGSGRIRLAWRYADDYPAEKPVTLFYSPTGQAPWQPICDPLENTGSFDWTIGADLPERVYVRIEARDQAGNVEVVQSPRPLYVHLPASTARNAEAGSTRASTVPK